MHLRWDDQELDISGLIPSLTVCIAVDELVNAENSDSFTALYAMAHQAPRAKEATRLPGALLMMPEELPGRHDDAAHHFIVTVSDKADERRVAAYNPKARLASYRHCVLAADWAGEGVYWITEAAK